MPRSKRKQGANGDFRQRLQSRGLAGIHPFDLYGLELSSGAPLAGCRGSPVPELKNFGAKRNKIPNRICELLEEQHGHVAQGCNNDRDRLLSLNNASQYLQFAKRSNNETAQLLRFWMSSVTVQNYSRRWSSCNNPGCDGAAETGVDPIGCVAAADPISDLGNPSGVSAEESAIVISSDESSHSKRDKKIAANKEPLICICSHEAKTLRSLLKHGKHCKQVPESARAKADPIRTNQCQYGCAVERAASRHERRTHYICLRSGNITLKRYAHKSSEPIDPVRYFLHAKVEEREQRSDNLVGALQGNAKPSEAEKLYKLEDSEIAAAFRLTLQQHYEKEMPSWNDVSTGSNKDLQSHQSYQHAPVDGPSPRKEAEHSNNHVPSSESSTPVLYIQQGSGSGATSPAVTESDCPVSEQTGNSPAKSASRATSVSPPGSCSQTTDELNLTTSLISPTSLCHGNSLSERYDQDLFLNGLQYWDDPVSCVHSSFESCLVMGSHYCSSQKRRFSCVSQDTPNVDRRYESPPPSISPNYAQGPVHQHKRQRHPDTSPGCEVGVTPSQSSSSPRRNEYNHLSRDPVCDLHSATSCLQRPTSNLSQTLTHVSTNAEQSILDYLQTPMNRRSQGLRFPVTLPLALSIPQRFLQQVENYSRQSFKSARFDNFESLITLSGAKLDSADLSAFDSYCFTAAMLIQKGSSTGIRHALDNACRLIKPILEARHPRTLPCFLEVLLHLMQNKLHAVARLICDFLQNMAACVIKTDDSLSQVYALLGEIDSESFYEVMVQTWRCITDVCDEELGNLHRLAVSVRLDYIKRVEKDNSQEEVFLRGLISQFDGSPVHAAPRVMLNLGHNMNKQGRFNEATSLAEQTRVMLQTHDAYSSRIVESIESLKLYSHAMFNLGSMDKAECSMQKAINMIIAEWGREHSWVPEFKTVLEGWFRYWGRKEDANALQQEIKELIEETKPDD